MEEIFDVLEKKLDTKFLLFLQKGEYKIYKNINKLDAGIPEELTDDKVLEVADYYKVDNEILYLVKADNQELGWVSLTNSIKILNCLEGSVTPNEELKENDLNSALGINSSLKTGQLYNAIYICRYKDDIYIGVEDNNEFIGFFPYNKLDFGIIEEVRFNFINVFSKVFKEYTLTTFNELMTKNQLFYAQRIYTGLGIGVTKIGKDEYWFKIEQTNIDLNNIKEIRKSYSDFYLEHLLKSIQIDKSIKSIKNQNDGKVSKEYVYKLEKRVSQLNSKNKEQQSTNKELQKEIKEYILDNTRKESKLDYFKRLTENYDKKINYYTQRNKNLETRVSVLEEKLDKVNKEHKEFKDSMLGKIHTKIKGK